MNSALRTFLSIASSRPLEAVEVTQGAQITFLHRIFGVVRVAHEIARDRVDLVEMR
jgi:hypothetical protein